MTLFFPHPALRSTCGWPFARFVVGCVVTFLACLMSGCGFVDSTSVILPDAVVSNPTSQKAGGGRQRSADDETVVADNETVVADNETVVADDDAVPESVPAKDDGGTPADASVGATLVDSSKTVVRQRTMKRSGGIYDLTFDDLEFAISPEDDFERDMLTAEIEALNGKPVILRGFIFDGSIYSQKGIKQFVLIRDNQQCCFGPGAKIFHNVMVEMVPGKSTKFTIRPVQVEGKFTIQPWVNPGDGKTYSVFHMDAHTVK